jgi:hypothetical protein
MVYTESGKHLEIDMIEQCEAERIGDKIDKFLSKQTEPTVVVCKTLRAIVNNFGMESVVLSDKLDVEEVTAKLKSELGCKVVELF